MKMIGSPKNWQKMYRTNYWIEVWECSPGYAVVRVADRDCNIAGRPGYLLGQIHRTIKFLLDRRYE